MTLGADEFLNVYDQIEGVILEDLAVDVIPQETIQWIKNLMSSTVPKGKYFRSKIVVDTFSILRGRDLTPEEFKEAYTVGWAIEFFQASCLIADDIMDESTMRRGAPCRHLQPGVGMIAINDLLFLESTAYHIIKHYFRKKPYYTKILELCHDMTWKTEIGQLTDSLFAQKAHEDVESVTMKDYEMIAVYKCGYYTFYTPIAVAMLLAGEEREDAFELARELVLPLSEVYQVQDDYLDCFGDPKVSGKIGTDIQDNKATWLSIKARELATPEQRALLKANYGRKDQKCIDLVKSIYRDLDIPGHYAAYEEKTCQEIKKRILASDSSLLPHRVILAYMERIYGRDM